MMKRVFLLLCALLIFAGIVLAQNLQLPQAVTAGAGLSIPTQGSGSATLYVYGPGTALKKDIKLGSPVQIDGDQVRVAGRYIVVIKGSENASGSFYVTPAKVENLAFLARPSRVPTARPDAITGSAYLLDSFDNLVLQPAPVKFDISVDGGSAATKTEQSKNGIAWVQLASGKKAGAADFVASAGDGSVKVQRVVEQTAAEPCNIQMSAKPDPNGGILVSTTPIRDCSGNPVPDGTIVTFTMNDATGKSTVDARIKKGIAEATLPPSKQGVITVASGVVLGNEVRWGGGK